MRTSCTSNSRPSDLWFKTCLCAAYVGTCGANASLVSPAPESLERGVLILSMAAGEEPGGAYLAGHA